MSNTEYHIYEMNDEEWWMATSPEEAIRDFTKEHDPEYMHENGPRRLSDEELDTNLIRNEDGEITRTYRQEMASREPRSQFFASVES